VDGTQKTIEQYKKADLKIGFAHGKMNLSRGNILQ
jgi:hypothetical protein